MLGFVDESGDTGFKFDKNSSHYFMVTLVLFEDDAEAERVRLRIDALRTELHAPGLEFHFAKNKATTRKAFLAAVSGYSFTIFSFVVDKTKISGEELGFKGRSEFYKTVCGMAFRHARPLLREANIQLDESGGKVFKRELAAFVKRHVNGDDKTYIRNMGAQESQGNNLVQMADMICGALYREFQGEADAEEYRKSITHHVHSVIIWPA